MFLLAVAMESALSLGGQEGFRRGSRKCMNPMHRKFADLLVSRVYLVDQCLLRQPYPAQQVGVARVGAKIVKLRVVWHRTAMASRESARLLIQTG